MGSSRDWAAKGTQLLGIKAVIAESFERIHRSNLVGMGVLPLQFKEGENATNLGLTGEETFSVFGINDIEPLSELNIVARRLNGEELKFKVITRLDTPIDIEYYQNRGILHTVLRNMINKIKSKEN
jgi:aconitate hydratase